MPDVARIALVLTLLPLVVASAKERTPPAATARIELTIIDDAGAPLAKRKVSFGYRSNDEVMQKTDAQGRVSMPVEGGVGGSIWVDSSSDRSAVSFGLAVVVFGGYTFDLGTVRVQRFGKSETLVWDERVHVVPLAGEGRPLPATAVVAAYATPLGGKWYFHALKIVHPNSVSPESSDELERTSVHDLRIAPDGAILGWLAPETGRRPLVLYRANRPLQTVAGTFPVTVSWRFVDSSRVSLRQESDVLGPRHNFFDVFPQQHHELRDIESGALLEKWEGDAKRSAPPWVRNFYNRATR